MVKYLSLQTTQADMAQIRKKTSDLLSLKQNNIFEAIGGFAQTMKSIM